MEGKKRKSRLIEQIKNKFSKNIYYRFTAFGVLLSLIPLLSTVGIMKVSTVSLFAYIIIFTIVAMGLNILIGYSGLISLGTAGFVGFGAYGVVYFYGHGIPYEFAALITLLIAALIGIFIGLFSLKVDGVYLAIATLAVGEIFSQVFKKVTWFTNAYGGVHFKFPKLFGVLQLQKSTMFIFLVVMMVLFMFIMYNIVHSRTGRALMAMSRSDSSAQAMGVSVPRYRLIAFIIATLFATTGGILYASFFRYVQPLDWNLMLTLLVLAMVVVGGVKSIIGTFLGVFVIYGVPTLWLEDLFAGTEGIAYIFSGVLIIIVVMFYPNGAVNVFQDFKKLYKKYKNGELKIKVKKGQKTNE
ncbi:branched-chain amino acid ABC transporter permease [Mycoplasmatota bacterium zrk1]